MNIDSKLSNLRNQSEADLRTERLKQPLNPNTQVYNISRSDHEMEFHHSLPPSDEIEMEDDIPHSETTRIPSLSRSSAMIDVAHQSSAVADNSNELERQRRIAEYERQQQEIRHIQQLELAKQNIVSELQL